MELELIMIVIENLTFSYIPNQPVFENFDWSIQQGETWAVLGPSGCGKSTLLYLLAGLRLPQSGMIKIHGKSITKPRPESGLIIQEFGLLPWATVRKNAELGVDIRRFYGPDGKHAPSDPQPASQDVEHWLQRLGVADQKNKFPSQISGGQRQRTAIARTLALNPDLLLMDEPFSALDAPTRESLQNLVLDLWRENNLTLVVVTHSIEEAAILGQKILLLQQPPTVTACIVENKNMQDPDFRNSPAYQKMCIQLRESM